MEHKKRYGLKQMLLATFWIALGGVTVFLLVAAIKKKDSNRCQGVAVQIHGVSNNYFVDKNDILNAITAMAKANPVGIPIGDFNLGTMESELEKDVWIKSVELFFDNNEILQVTVNEREPLARVFTAAGTTFYIDEELAMLPLSEKYSARLPIFTGFPSDKKVLQKADSILLGQIKAISLAIQKDSFSMAMIEQVDITAGRLFEMIPKIGNQLIVFGGANDIEKKLGKLKMFYSSIMTKAGWNRYSTINLQYENQVIAKRKGVDDIAADSLRTLQLIQMIAERTQREANDALLNMQLDGEQKAADSSMIERSIQRDDQIETADNTELPGETPVQEKPVTATKPVGPKIELKQVPVPVKKTDTGVKARQKPKALMEKQNDYNPGP